MRPSPTLRWNILALAHSADRRRNLLRQRRKSRAAMRQVLAYRDLSEAEFVKTFRLGKVQVRELTEEIVPFLPASRRQDGISTELKVLVALAFYATGSYQTLVGQSALHNVSQSTVSRAVRQVTEALNEIYKNHVVWPTQSHERNVIKSKFFARFGIPGVLGCIDGTHIAILRPVHHEERYYNRKGYHSLNVMIICDADLNILCVDASSPGSAHDSMVWQGHPLNSHLLELSNNGEQVFLLGDSGYPLRSTMMTPILDTREGTAEHNFYKAHVTARNSVERCIGVLKARFRCLLAARALHYNPITAGKIVNACCVLHNIANRHGLPVTLLTREEEDTESHQQHQQLRVEAAGLLDASNRRVDINLQRGRALQSALVLRLWRERRQN